MLNGRVILSLNEHLIDCIEAEKERTGATRNSIVSRILEGYFSEQQAKKRLYNEWFMTEVEKGIKSAREEPLVEHEEVASQIHEIIAKAREENASRMV